MKTKHIEHVDRKCIVVTWLKNLKLFRKYFITHIK